MSKFWGTSCLASASTVLDRHMWVPHREQSASRLRSMQPLLQNPRCSSLVVLKNTVWVWHTAQLCSA